MMSFKEKLPLSKGEFRQRMTTVEALRTAAEEKYSQTFRDELTGLQIESKTTLEDQTRVLQDMMTTLQKVVETGFESQSSTQQDTVMALQKVVETGFESQSSTLEVAVMALKNTMKADFAAQSHTLLNELFRLQKETELLKGECSSLKQKLSALSGEISKEKPKRLIQHLDFHLVEHCNLNCRGCSTFSPLANEKFADHITFEADLKRLHTLVGDRVLRIHLLGGEPLLHPQIEQFGIAARSVFPEARLDFTTNGLLIFKMPESFWETLREQKIAIKYTRYPVNFNYDKMVEYIRTQGVEVFSAAGEIRYFRRIPMNTSGAYNIYNSYSKCPYSDCVQLREGKLFLCPAAAFSDILNRSLFKEGRMEQFLLTSNDYVDLYQARSMKNVFDFLSNATAFCQYCDMNRIDEFVPWQTSEQKTEEWVD